MLALSRVALALALVVVSTACGATVPTPIPSQSLGPPATSTPSSFADPCLSERKAATAELQRLQADLTAAQADGRVAAAETLLKNADGLSPSGLAAANFGGPVELDAPDSTCAFSNGRVGRLPAVDADDGWNIDYTGQPLVRMVTDPTAPVDLVVPGDPSHKSVPRTLTFEASAVRDAGDPNLALRVTVMAVQGDNTMRTFNHVVRLRTATIDGTEADLAETEECLAYQNIPDPLTCEYALAPTNSVVTEMIVLLSLDAVSDTPTDQIPDTVTLMLRETSK